MAVLLEDRFGPGDGRVAKTVARQFDFAAFRADDAGEMLLPLEHRATATWVLAGHEIIYSTSGDMDTPAALWAFDLETRRKRMIHSTGDVPLARGLALSPEGTSVLFAQLDRWQSNIVVADYEFVK